MSETKIEWADCVVNPLPGCRRVSPACEHCYAERMASRLALMPQSAERYAGLTRDGRWTGETRWVPSELGKVLRWRKPRAIFWGSMGDIPGHATLEQWTLCMAVAAMTPQHAHLFLTKDPSRMLEKVQGITGHPYPPQARMNDVMHLHMQDAVSFAPAPLRDAPWPLPNVWLGCTVEDQKRADERMPHLLRLAAMGWHTFVSYEPALGPVNWRRALGAFMPDTALGAIIGGGESGPKARPSHPDWFRAARDACESAGVDFYFKQWGEWGYADDYRDVRDAHRTIRSYGTKPDGSPDSVTHARYGKHAAGRHLDGRLHDDLPWRRWMSERAGRAHG